MSVLAGKNILIVGDDTSKSAELEKALKMQQMQVYHTKCDETAIPDLAKNNINVVLLNHLHDGNACNLFFTELKNTRYSKEVSVFTLVENTQSKIQQALMLGAADYITVDESVASIVNKIKIMLGQPDNYSGSNLFDVPLDIPTVTSKGRRVLVVEDDSLLRNLLDTKLTISSFPHEFVKTGEGVLEAARAFRPNVIILDLMLPIRNGFEILADLKADTPLSNIPVIVFSNRDSEDDKKKTFELGADRYYVKAMTDLSTIIEAIEELT